MEPDPNDDRSLLAAYAAGDETAFARVVERHRALVWGLARAVVGTAAADDVCQAVFLLLARKAGRVAKREAPVADWLLGCVRRVGANHRRGEARRSRRERSASAASAASAADHDLPTDLLVAAIDQLPSGLRRAVVLHHLDGLDRAEVARRLACTPAALDKRLQRALSSLRRTLARRGYGRALGATLAALGLATRAQAGVSTAAITAGIAQPSASVLALSIGGSIVPALVVPAVLLAIVMTAAGAALAHPPASGQTAMASPPAAGADRMPATDPVAEQDDAAAAGADRVPAADPVAEQDDAAVHLFRSALLLAGVADREESAVEEAYDAWFHEGRWAVEIDGWFERTPRYAQVLHSFERAAAAGDCRWQRDLSRAGPGFLLPELEPLRWGVRLLQLRAAWHTRAGRNQAAATDLSTVVALGRHLQRDGILIMRLSGIAIETDAWNQVLGAMADWEPELRRATAERLAAIPPPPPPARTLVGERAMVQWFQRELRSADANQRLELLRNVGFEGPELLAALAVEQMTALYAEVDAWYAAVATAYDLPRDRAYAALDALEDRAQRNPILRVLAPALDVPRRHIDYADDLAAVGIARLRDEAVAGRPWLVVEDAGPDLVLRWPDTGEERRIPLERMVPAPTAADDF